MRRPPGFRRRGLLAGLVAALALAACAPLAPLVPNPPAPARATPAATSSELYSPQ